MYRDSSGGVRFHLVTFLRWEKCGKRWEIVDENGMSDIWVFPPQKFINSKMVFPFKPSILGVFPLFLETPIL